MKPKLYYHFTGDTLRDGSAIPQIGDWLVHKGEVVPCESGLHASDHPFDAMQYAKGGKLHLVELGDVIIANGDPVDKVASNKRKIVATIDATEVMRAFARRCALDVLPLWKDAPEIVVRYLKTGDESIRAAARDAAWAAARAAGRDAAWDAARAAAWAAAWDAAWAAAWDAAWAAARDASFSKYRGWFKEMVDTEFQKKGKTV